MPSISRKRATTIRTPLVPPRAKPDTSMPAGPAATAAATVRLLNQEVQNVFGRTEVMVCMLNATDFLISFFNEARFVSVDNV